ncbi:unnamed protein product [Closterium sp. Naga37s-1]|nr:unnamed protein product [Closterium sp. Naga37s-1]
MFHDPCSMPHVPCPMFHAPCSMPHVPCPMFHAPCSMPHVPCPMFHAPCSMPHVPCPMFHAPCSMPHVPCPMFHAPFLLSSSSLENTPSPTHSKLNRPLHPLFLNPLPRVPSSSSPLPSASSPLPLPPNFPTSCPCKITTGSVEKRRRELQDEMSHLAAEIGRLFLAASRRRRVAAEDLGERVEGVLRGLEMGAARFRAVVSWEPAAPHFYSATSAPLSQSQLSMQERRRGGGGEGVRARRVGGSGGWGREVESEWEEEGEGDEEEEREEEEEEDDEEEEGEEEEESGQQKQHGTEILVEEGLIRVEGAESVGERSDVLYRYSSTGMDRVGGMSTRVGGMSVMCITHLPHADTHMSVSAGGKKGKDKVICITHLPQVAVYADAHIVVSKHMDGVDGRMRTTAAPLLPLHSPCPTPPFPQVICITHLPQVAVHADAHISVICITHLPQVAVHADAHISVSKHMDGADGRMRTTAARLTTLEERVRLGRGTGEARREELVRLGRGTGEARREERASEVAQMLGLGLPSALELFKAKGGMERAVNTVNTERHLKAVQRDA